VKEVNVHEAKTHLSRLLMRVAAGEEITISKAGKPVARLVPYQSSRARRVPGKDQGLIRIASDFDAPLPEDLLKDFEG
jgi:prevent-host-death family protein